MKILVLTIKILVLTITCQKINLSPINHFIRGLFKNINIWIFKLHNTWLNQFIKII